MEMLRGEREAEIEELKGTIEELKVSSARGRPVVDTSVVEAELRQPLRGQSGMLG